MPKLEEMVARHPGETVALVGHTVLNRVILLAVLGLGNDRFWHISQGTCGINEILSLDNGYVLVSMNNTWHLL
jgi:broad specificity phosphatase PhoE